MTTKEIERKALAQIKKIVEGLGENSYIATAMDGMFEDAEENIENDFAMSWKDRANTYEKKLEELAKIYDHDTYEANKKQELTEKELELAKTTIKQQSEQYHTVRDQMNKYKTELNDATDKVVELQKENDILADEIKCLKEDYEEQIMKLKAKLYDLMVK